jgi:hypothetical protein
MKRLTVVSVFLLFVIQAQAQVFSRGVPAGATSIEPDGRIHGVPSNVQSPTPIPAGVHLPRNFNGHGNLIGPFRHFGDSRHHHRILIPVPVFYPIYGYPDAGYPADPYVQPSSDQAQSPAASSDQQDDAAAASSEDSLRQAYLQGARDALKDERDRTRYGDHYLDSREQQRSRSNDDTAQRNSSSSSDNTTATAMPVKEDSSPATVFIFKDGHQIETRNFAIMGETLYDFSSSILKKVQLADLDKDATVKANDDRGTTVKLP